MRSPEEAAGLGWPQVQLLTDAALESRLYGQPEVVISVFSFTGIRSLDVLACPACGGRLRLIALIFDPGTVRAILDSSAVSATLGDRAPPAAVPGARA